jgi:hypothetical protein
MYVQSLHMTNLRMFASASVHFSVPGEGREDGALPNVTVLLGDNASGKTTLLRAIAMAALSPVMISSSGFVPYGLVRRTTLRTEPDADIRGTFKRRDEPGAGHEDLWLKLRSNPSSFTDRVALAAQPQWSEAYWNDHSPDLLVLGYGANRRVDPTGGTSWMTQSKERQLRFLRVASLFEDAVMLRSLSTWLLDREHAGRRAQVLRLMNSLAPDLKVQLNSAKDDLEYAIRGSAVPFAALSEGYRAFLGWVGDLLYHVTSTLPAGAKLADARGMVLVDEVDLHLHPAWQQTVVQRLARALPNLQFILSTHSPLIVGGLHRTNVRVIDSVEREGVSQAVVRPAAEELYGRSADQLLTSSLFGLLSARPEDFARRMSEAASRARRGDVDATEQVLQMMVYGEAGSPGTPPARRRSANGTTKP